MQNSEMKEQGEKTGVLIDWTCPVGGELAGIQSLRIGQLSESGENI